MNRQDCNLEILNDLRTLVYKYPDYRFFQILTNCKLLTGSHVDENNKLVVTDPFFEESYNTMLKLKQYLNEYDN